MKRGPRGAAAAAAAFAARPLSPRARQPRRVSEPSAPHVSWPRGASLAKAQDDAPRGHTPSGAPEKAPHAGASSASPPTGQAAPGPQQLRSPRLPSRPGPARRSDSEHGGSRTGLVGARKASPPLDDRPGSAALQQEEDASESSCSQPEAKSRAGQEEIGACSGQDGAASEQAPQNPAGSEVARTAPARGKIVNSLRPESPKRLVPLKVLPVAAPPDPSERLAADSSTGSRTARPSPATARPLSPIRSFSPQRLVALVSSASASSSKNPAAARAPSLRETAQARLRGSRQGMNRLASAKKIQAGIAVKGGPGAAAAGDRAQQKSTADKAQLARASSESSLKRLKARAASREVDSTEADSATSQSSSAGQEQSLKKSNSTDALPAIVEDFVGAEAEGLGPGAAMQQHVYHSLEQAGRKMSLSEEHEAESSSALSSASSREEVMCRNLDSSSSSDGEDESSSSPSYITDAIAEKPVEELAEPSTKMRVAGRNPVLTYLAQDSSSDSKSQNKQLGRAPGSPQLQASQPHGGKLGVGQSLPTKGATAQMQLNPSAGTTKQTPARGLPVQSSRVVLTPHVHGLRSSGPRMQPAPQPSSRLSQTKPGGSPKVQPAKPGQPKQPESPSAKQRPGHLGSAGGAAASKLAAGKGNPLKPAGAQGSSLPGKRAASALDVSALKPEIPGALLGVSGDEAPGATGHVHLAPSQEPHGEELTDGGYVEPTHAADLHTQLGLRDDAAVSSGQQAGAHEGAGLDDLVSLQSAASAREGFSGCESQQQSSVQGGSSGPGTGFRAAAVREQMGQTFLPAAEEKQEMAGLSLRELAKRNRGAPLLPVGAPMGCPADAHAQAQAQMLLQMQMQMPMQMQMQLKMQMQMQQMQLQAQRGPAASSQMHMHAPGGIMMMPGAGPPGWAPNSHMEPDLYGQMLHNPDMPQSPYHHPESPRSLRSGSWGSEPASPSTPGRRRTGSAAGAKGGGLGFRQQALSRGLASPAALVDEETAAHLAASILASEGLLPVEEAAPSAPEAPEESMEAGTGEADLVAPEESAGAEAPAAAEDSVEPPEPQLEGKDAVGESSGSSFRSFRALALANTGLLDMGALDMLEEMGQQEEEEEVAEEEGAVHGDGGVDPTPLGASTPGYGDEEYEGEKDARALEGVAEESILDHDAEYGDEEYDEGDEDCDEDDEACDEEDEDESYDVRQGLADSGTEAKKRPTVDARRLSTVTETSPLSMAGAPSQEKAERGQLDSLVIKYGQFSDTREITPTTFRGRMRKLAHVKAELTAFIQRAQADAHEAPQRRWSWRGGISVDDARDLGGLAEGELEEEAESKAGAAAEEEDEKGMALARVKQVVLVQGQEQDTMQAVLCGSLICNFSRHETVIAGPTGHLRLDLLVDSILGVLSELYFTCYSPQL